MIRLVVFFLFLTLWNSISNSVENNFSIPSPEFCKESSKMMDLKNIDNQKIKFIEVKLNNNRKWSKNSLKILIGNFRLISSEFKKRFGAKVIVKYDNNFICSLNASIRQSGGQRDHIKLKDNSILQSIDVNLKNGHIQGITKFKLLIPNTRGSYEDEIFQTTLLRQIGYLAPRTKIIDASVNGIKSKMIFQEKSSKELLEYNLRREGPILEGDERFVYRLAKELPSNHLGSWESGMMKSIEKGVKAMLTKQLNSNFALKSDQHKLISENAISNLNLIYLLWSNNYKDEKNDFYFFSYGLDNRLLGFNNPKNILKLDIYNLLIQSTNSHHSLAAINRQFYWNPIESYFEPINYDSNIKLDIEPNQIRFPITNETKKAFKSLEKILEDIDINNLYNSLLNTGINLSVKSINGKLKLIKKNLQVLKKHYNNLDKDLISYNQNKKIEISDWENYYQSLKNIDPNIHVVKHLKEKSEISNFEGCKVETLSCEKLNLNNELFTDLIGGNLNINNKEYQYLGKNADKVNFINENKYQKIDFENFKLFHTSGVKINFDQENKVLDIKQTTAGSRVFLFDGKIQNMTINFTGVQSVRDEIPYFPIDIKALTGCLTLINLQIKNISITSDKSSCEDSINFINVKGEVDNILIKNSFMDGLDIDFSNVQINKAEIYGAGNDCLDFSNGNYKLNQILLSNCGDKALSIGEKSFLELDKIKINNSNIGVASKDSSITSLNTISLENLKTCVAAYNKKQEYYGSFIKIKEMNCRNYDKKIDKDNSSKIIIENEI